MDDKMSFLQKIFANKVQVDISMSEYTKIGIGGPVEYFLSCKNIDDFNQNIKLAQENKIKHLAIKFSDDVLITTKGLRGFIIFLNDLDTKPKQKVITLFRPIVVDENLKKITEFSTTNKYLLPQNLLNHLGLINKIFGGLKQDSTNPNFAINFNQATVDDVVIMTSYLKQKVRNNIGIQLRDNYKIILDNN
jgi:UDP-N-acetylenolpyruvoylglucosamine reductase